MVRTNNFLLSFLLISYSISLVYGATSSLSAARKNGLNRHNFYRKKHGVPNLALSTFLNTKAQAYSDYLAKNNLFEHSKNRYGENLYKYSSTSTIKNLTTVIIKATDAWYNEIKNYNFNKPGFSMATGHFTQVVWKSSKTLGIGITIIKCGSWYCAYVVANYNPPGNYVDDFKQNVLPPK